MIKVPTNKCPECGRDWPDVSEQGVHLSKYGHCYQCMLTDINETLTPLKEVAEYTIETCYTCSGIEEQRHACLTCYGKGWLGEPKVTLTANG